MISKTVIHLKTEEEFRSLLKVMNDKGVAGADDSKLECWEVFLDETCVVDEDRFAFGSTKYFTECKCKIITYEEFLKQQK